MRRQSTVSLWTSYPLPPPLFETISPNELSRQYDYSRAKVKQLALPLEQAYLLGFRVVPDGELALQHLQQVLAGQLTPPALQDGQFLRGTTPALQREQFQVRRSRQELRRDGRLHGPHLQGRAEQIRQPRRFRIDPLAPLHVRPLVIAHRQSLLDGTHERLPVLFDV